MPVGCHDQIAMIKSSALPPAVVALTLRQWLRKNLFSGPLNSLLTLGCLLLIAWGGGNLLHWSFGVAQWGVIQENFPRFFVGRYPQDQWWRLGVLLVLILGTVATALWAHQKRRLGSILLALPFISAIALWLIGGGLGLATVPTSLWNGLLLTLLVSFSSTVLAFPLGVALAVARQRQELPILQLLSTGYIELVRGLPLIGILFMAQIMVPLVLPQGWQWDRLLRAIAGLVLFNAAYLAENVRGGLQAIPKGQTEAAQSLGLNPLLTLGLVVLPQALRIAIPAIAGQFIALFKDTALLSLFALLELTGIARSVLAQPQFLGRYNEVYLFIGMIYWLFCFGLSRMSRRLE
ncbi:amino acid ABC transporter permease [Candidatus Synechococcus calcipolaris G9]|uniref:Amino acid ABC transporter permease n=1 Tax=Candidatus Synechococcus calcipolaris G9 TaxID=1497997 RepID=A0ABT6EZ62_9SYNE|nr:amino acid ABC transporter permease [Candidatus Synechococcus calcipolaris]MDG2990770.1 amino acid ABC transporter permease [Candidatus Synechococcus calcipolaris G9]